MWFIYYYYLDDKTIQDKPTMQSRKHKLEKQLQGKSFPLSKERDQAKGKMGVEILSENLNKVIYLAKIDAPMNLGCYPVVKLS
jgi:hypothetical protein